LEGVERSLDSTAASRLADTGSKIVLPLAIPGLSSGRFQSSSAFSLVLANELHSKKRRWTFLHRPQNKDGAGLGLIVKSS